MQSHSKCSETFYKKEVESDIQSDSRSSEERLKMLELLKKFETENSGMDLEGEGDDDDDDDDDDLVRRFEDVDLSELADHRVCFEVLTTDRFNMYR